MRRSASQHRLDSNHQEIVDALRAIGATVINTHMVGGGCGDILVGWRQINYLLEIKDGSKKPSARKLTPAEKEFHDAWRGQVAIVESVDDAFQVIGAIQC